MTTTKTNGINFSMPRIYVIGLDPGATTGIAMLYFPPNSRSARIISMSQSKITIMEARRRIGILIDVANEDPASPLIIIGVEIPAQILYARKQGKPGMIAKSLAAGQNRGRAIALAEVLEDTHGKDRVRRIKPTTKKWTAEYFRARYGRETLKSHEHMRDAVKIAEETYNEIARRAMTAHARGARD